MPDRNHKIALLYWPGMYSRRQDVDAMREDVGPMMHQLGVDFFPMPARYGVFTRSIASRVANRIMQDVRGWSAQNPQYEHIILAGHSFGGLFARRVWLNALQSQDALDQQWASRLMGFVLVGSPDRGVDLDRLPSPWRQLAGLGRFLGIYPHSLLADATRGSDFITELRLDWIDDRLRNERGAAVSHILGTKDDLVTRDDCLDNRQFTAPHVVNLSGANHYMLASARLCADQSQFVDAWRSALAHVIVQHSIDSHDKSLKDHVLTIHNELDCHARALIATPNAARPASEMFPEKTVVFLLHGIRASNHDWPMQLRKIIQQRHADWEVIAPGYGYFSALRFALPWLRVAPISWFKDQYTTYLDQYRNVTFHFIGHSNGTYVFGHALKQCRGIRFDRVCLVGSVLPTDFDLDAFANARRVGAVRVDCSSKDWPVGLLCALMSGIGMRDVGTAGIDGFRASHGNDETVRYHDGGHGRPLETDRINDIADFLDNQMVKPANLASIAWWLGWPSRMLRHRIGALFAVLVLLSAVFFGLFTLYLSFGFLVTSVVGGVVLLGIILIADTL